eukprot:4429497-Amphidinium_carterae.1
MELYGRGGISAKEAGDMMAENAAARVKSCDVLKPKMRAAAITKKFYQMRGWPETTMFQCPVKDTAGSGEVVDKPVCCLMPHL